jgi:class 3 adenylate cyclase
VSTAVCSACGTGNNDGAKFCNECGAPLQAVCPSCGAPSSGKFCSECGAALTAAPVPAVPAQPTAPVAERRIASLLFGDLVGFTTISEARDPEAVRELLSAYFERARTVVERYGGTIEKFIGDAVFAVWGVPTAHEDDAERAVRAGLDLISAVVALGEEQGVDGLQMRVGVMTGQVAVTLGAVGEGMVAGDAVNTAARIQSVASPGEVWVDDTTRSLTTASLAYESKGSYELKGKASQVELFHAIRTTAVVGGEQRVDGLEAPFVGRDRELRLVKELFHATAEEGRPRLVLVVGEPGIGKSRLAWEFEKYIDAIPAQETFWLRGRCLSYGNGVGGRVMAEMVRSLLRVTETDAVDTVRAALDERLQRHVDADDERELLRPRLESLLGLSDRVFDHDDLFASWRGFLEALTRDDEDSSVTLVVEDLQWADDGFLDFLQHLLEFARAPIMVLALARPDITDVRPAIGTGRRTTMLFLEPLRESAMAALLDGLVGNLPDSLRAELLARAEGIPLYAVETIRTLIDRDIVVPSEGRYVVNTEAAKTLDLKALGPPASLQALLGARLDALTDDERRVVQDASVLGLSFTQAGIEALSPPGLDLGVALEGLRRKEILTVDTDPRSPERGQYRFVQALLRTIAYDTLAKRDRHIRHVAAAEYLGTLPDVDTIAGVVAAHYLDALDSQPGAADSDALRERAIGLLEQAANHGIATGAPASSLSHFRRLVSLDPDPETLVRITITTGVLARTNPASVSSAVEEIADWVRQSLEFAETNGWTMAVLELRLTRAQLFFAKRQDDESLAQGQTEALEVMEQCIGHPERIAVLTAAGMIATLGAQNTNDVPMAREVSLKVLTDVERYGDDDDFAQALAILGVWSSMEGMRRMSTLIQAAAVERMEPRNHSAVRAMVNLAAGLVHDDPVEAIALSTEARRIGEQLGRLDLGGICHALIGSWMTGDWARGRGIFVDVADVAVESQFAADWQAYLRAIAALYARSTADATLLLDEVVAAKTSSDPVVAAWWSMAEAVAQEVADETTAAAAVAARAVDQMVELGPATEDVPPAFGLAVDLLLAVDDKDRLESLTAQLEQVSVGARFRHLHGQLLRARAHLSADPVPGLRQAIDVLTDMGAAYLAAVPRVELAEVLARRGDHAAADEVAAAAEPLLTEIGAQPLLDRIAAMRAAVPVS